MNNKCYIYVIGTKDTNVVKIGYSQDPTSRLQTLQTGNPLPLVLHYTRLVESNQARIVETMVHKNLRHMTSKGEWFKIDPKSAQAEIEYACIMCDQ